MSNQLRLNESLRLSLPAVSSDTIKLIKVTNCEMSLFSEKIISELSKQTNTENTKNVLKINRTVDTFEPLVKKYIKHKYPLTEIFKCKMAVKIQDERERKSIQIKNNKPITHNFEVIQVI